MTRIRTAIVLFACSLQVCLAEEKKAPSRSTATVHWPQFRGPDASGVAEGSAPTKWDASTGTNVKWKTPIPGLGHSSPVIWGDQIFVTSAVSASGDEPLKVGLYGDIEPVKDDSEQSFRVLCIHKKDGSKVWDREACKGVPKIKRHTKATHANSTPATDGKHVVAFFGSEGLYCYTVDGELKWKKDFGVLDSGYYTVPDAQWGFASSPVIHEGVVLVQCDVQQDSFIAAFAVADGKELWRTPREEVPTWSTPTVYRGGGSPQVIANGYKHIGAYDLDTGKVRWKLRGGGDIPVPTPIIAHDLIFITNGHGNANPVYAIRTTAKGEIEIGDDKKRPDQVAWSQMRIGNYMQTPIVFGDLLYCCRDNGILAVYDAKTGKNRYKDRLGSGSTGFTASPVAAGGSVYFTSEEGDVYVVPAGPDKPDKEAIIVNPLGEVMMSTPAISEGRLFFRGQKNLFCIGE